MTAAVVDVSVAATWFLTEEQQDAALRLLESDRELLAPECVTRSDLEGRTIPLEDAAVALRSPDEPG